MFLPCRRSIYLLFCASLLTGVVAQILHSQLEATSFCTFGHMFQGESDLVVGLEVNRCFCITVDGKVSSSSGSVSSCPGGIQVHDLVFVPKFKPQAHFQDERLSSQHSPSHGNRLCN